MARQSLQVKGPVLSDYLSPTSALSQDDLGEIGHFQRFRGKKPQGNQAPIFEKPP